MRKRPFVGEYFWSQPALLVKVERRVRIYLQTVIAKLLCVDFGDLDKRVFLHFTSKQAELSIELLTRN